LQLYFIADHNEIRVTNIPGLIWQASQKSCSQLGIRPSISPLLYRPAFKHTPRYAY